jgi:tRNA(adenine34) deaminase
MDDIGWMQTALMEARRARDEDEVPIGCVIVEGTPSAPQGRLLAKAHNQTRQLHDPTAHAEMIAITQAANALSSERLTDTTLYVTIEPCAMCVGAIFWARIARVVFGAPDAKAGACGSVVDLSVNERLNHHLTVSRGILADECAKVMSAFFEGLRKHSTGR